MFYGDKVISPSEQLRQQIEVAESRVVDAAVAKRLANEAYVALVKDESIVEGASQAELDAAYEAGREANREYESSIDALLALRRQQRQPAAPAAKQEKP